ncbi:hypothetical protein MGYG_04405 [Nannizzia gypsea CBS 118893]|uniref:Uncharacterized protein n=1 Tax=Arthroderma gypseum (strain ATCC MYA-4604 / CBS 118893) TaxID=535722 RepID=E4USU9_ARTGP|nr:hypothetical protein MGYG_04405 [Nannizzia gypsea CBS 118893]EFR01398.1 hypothetical protein MGYG_04405 [Nannizzia gypsea CBS 118893]
MPLQEIIGPAMLAEVDMLNPVYGQELGTDGLAYFGGAVTDVQPLSVRRDAPAVEDVVSQTKDVKKEKIEAAAPSTVGFDSGMAAVFASLALNKPVIVYQLALAFESGSSSFVKARQEGRVQVKAARNGRSHLPHRQLDRLAWASSPWLTLTSLSPTRERQKGDSVRPRIPTETRKIDRLEEEEVWIAVTPPHALSSILKNELHSIACTSLLTTT